MLAPSSHSVPSCHILVVIKALAEQWSFLDGYLEHSRACSCIGSLGAFSFLSSFLKEDRAQGMPGNSDFSLAALRLGTSSTSPPAWGRQACRKLVWSVSPSPLLSSPYLLETASHFISHLANSTQNGMLAPTFQPLHFRSTARETDQTILITHKGN